MPQVNWEHDGFRAEAAQWDREAEEYEGRRGGDGRYMAGIEAAVRSLDAQPGATVLDAGCGTGLTTRRLVATGCSVTGMDLSVESLVYLRDRTAGGELRVVQGDVTSLPFGDGSFDRVLCANTLQQLEGNDRRQACIREVVRVLRPGGRLVLTVQQYSVPRRWAGWAREGPTGRRVRYVYRFSREEFCRLLDEVADTTRVRGAGFPLSYRFKVGGASRWVERAFQQAGPLTPMADLLVGVVDKPDCPKIQTPRS